MTTSNTAAIRKMWAVLTSAERRKAIALLGLIFIGMVIETLGVGVVVPAIALLTQPDFATRYPALRPFFLWLGSPTRETLVAAGMLLLASVYLVKTVYLSFLAWWQMRFVFQMQTRLSQKLFTVYLRQPYAFHLQRNSSQLIRNVTSEVTHFTTGATLSTIVLVTESLVLVALGSLLLAAEPLGAVIVVSVIGAAGGAFYKFSRRRVASWGESRIHHEGLRFQHLQQGLGGAKDVKLLGREADFLEQYRSHNLQSARIGEKLGTMQALPRLWLELLAVIGLSLLVLGMLQQGRPVESVMPALGLFAAAAFRIMPSVNRVVASLQSLRFSLPVVEIVHAELGLATPEADDADRPRYRFRNSVEISHVSYTYPNASRPALRDISLCVQRGESVGFFGTSGAGKSTLVDVVLGLLTPDQGEIRVDGNSIQENLRAWQDQIGYVPQSIFLTDDTLRRNVAFGIPEDQIDTEAVLASLRAAQLEDFILSLPDGLNTMVGERGVRLSGGQRQRIGIARALYHAPSVLVLDEATSSLDVATERDVMDAVLALQGTKTMLIVAHRFSAVEHCDRLYRLEHGRLIDESAGAGISEGGRQRALQEEFAPASKGRASAVDE